MNGAETSMLSSLMPEEGALHVVYGLIPTKMFRLYPRNSEAFLG